MTIDKSLVSKEKLRRRRNVLSRGERIEQLIGEEKWEEGRSAFGLPKGTRQRVRRKIKVQKTVEEAAETLAEGEEATQAEGDASNDKKTKKE